MDIFKINDLSFRYPDMENKVLDHVTIHIPEGEFVVVCGPSGCGKTTLLRLLKTELAPVGESTGEIYYFNKLLNSWDNRKLIEEIGFVFQDPENQIVMDEVMQEIVFSLENLGYSHFEMRKRVAELVHSFGMEHLLEYKPSELSGGQKQLLNLLSILLLKPKVLLLDEPTSQLDPVAAKDLIIMLERLNKEMGITIVLVEHRLEELFAIADRVLMMDEGKIVHAGDSKEVIYKLYKNNDEQFIPYVPAVSRLYLEIEQFHKIENIPLTVKESKEWMNELPSDVENSGQSVQDSFSITHHDTILSVKNTYFQYDKDLPMILKNLSLQIKQGDYFAIIGGNGSGKTTLLKACLGMIKPQRGSARYLGKDITKLKGKELYKKFAYLPQNPRIYFIQDTMVKEMQEVINQHKIENGSAKIEEMLDLFGIAHLRNRHPYDCSGGELQKAALACMLLSKPEILFIDEPTKGLDPISKQHFGKIIKELHKTGMTIVMVTHDIEFAAINAHRCAIMFDGAITVDGTPKELFKGNYFYTTAINRATRMSNLPEVLTLEEALEIWPDHVLTY
ncbi:ABC transporter ATP-binding protein [Oceanobacillus bengalensis]|uniref:ATP-binding cassette domain-containing protein n=2 Tax=Oceanobacillus bengalensis TaxID=1435466 RepID=A0A494YXR5_9BACI|nr:ABC transporter ATP-binding protein [Oceanobacillus bengalensis]RKQ15003.1 ATP-binding cassette domain-containing protein [Oceanobacillus bengalensis]